MPRNRLLLLAGNVLGGRLHSSTRLLLRILVLVREDICPWLLWAVPGHLNHLDWCHRHRFRQTGPGFNRCQRD